MGKLHDHLFDSFKKIFRGISVFALLIICLIVAQLIIAFSGYCLIEWQIVAIIVTNGITALLLSYFLFKDNKEQQKREELLLRHIDERVSSVEYKFWSDYNKTDNRIGVQTIYLDYKKLEVTDLAKLLNSYYTLYTLFYQISSPDNESWKDIEQRFKNRPEDILEILSVHTGNSIILKTKTGWTPTIDYRDGNFELGLPKGFVTLIFLGYILQKTISYGITNYKDLLEIENQRLENEKLRLELQEMKEKCKNQNPEVDKKIQIEIYNFYEVTIQNKNIKKIEIDQNTTDKK